jgi:hypothetical protein
MKSTNSLLFNNASIANGAIQTVQNTASGDYTRSADQGIARVYQPVSLN